MIRAAYNTNWIGDYRLIQDALSILFYRTGNTDVNFTLLGGTAIDLELSGVAEGRIYAQSLTAQLYEVVNIMAQSGAGIMSGLIVILLLTTW